MTEKMMDIVDYNVALYIAILTGLLTAMTFLIITNLMATKLVVVFQLIWLLTLNVVFLSYLAVF